jgi:hypothetical protein
MRAARLAERVEENVATARIKVPPAVASEAIVPTSAIGGSVALVARKLARRRTVGW